MLFRSLPPIVGREVHAVGFDEYPGFFAKLSIARKRQPLVIEIDADLRSSALRLGGKIVVSHVTALLNGTNDHFHIKWYGLTSPPATADDGLGWIPKSDGALETLEFGVRQPPASDHHLAVFGTACQAGNDFAGIE